MPKAKTKQEGLLDTWGRRNRKHADIECLECGTVFRPRVATTKYCSRPCMYKNNGKNQKKKPERWRIGKQGYIIGRVWEDGQSVFYRYHRWLLEQHLGRKLLPSEVVHHKNGNKLDNRIENLKIMENGSHVKMHHTERRKKCKTGNIG